MGSGRGFQKGGLSTWDVYLDEGAVGSAGTFGEATPDPGRFIRCNYRPHYTLGYNSAERKSA